MKPTRLFLACVVAGWAVWSSADSPPGRQEPWDAQNQGPWIAALAAVGAIAGLLQPRGAWRWGVGVYAGQAIGLVQSSASASGGLDPLVVLGMLFLVPYSAPALLGSIVGASWLLRRLPPERSDDHAPQSSPTDREDIP